MKKKIIVLGGNGFIGQSLIKELSNLNYEILSIDINAPPKMITNVNYITHDFTKLNEIENVFEYCSVIYHLVSTTIPETSNKNPNFDIESNLIGSINLLEIARRNNTGKIIFTSSGGTVYGNQSDSILSESSFTNPICSYGIVKLSIEKYLKMYNYLYGIDSCILRISNPYGSNQINTNQGVITNFCRNALNGNEITIWGDGSISRDFIYISDLVNLLIKVKDQKSNAEIFNVGSGRSTSINELINVIENLLGKNILVKYLQDREFDLHTTNFDISKVKSAFNWKPEISLSQGIQKLLNSFSIEY